MSHSDPQVEDLAKLLSQRIHDGDPQMGLPPDEAIEMLCKAIETPEEKETFKKALLHQPEDEHACPLHLLLRSGLIHALPEELTKSCLSSREALTVKDSFLNTTLHLIAEQPEGYHYPTLKDASGYTKEDLLSENLSGDTPIVPATINQQLSVLGKAQKQMAAEALITPIPEPESLGARKVLPIEQVQNHPEVHHSLFPNLVEPIIPEIKEAITKRFHIEDSAKTMRNLEASLRSPNKISEFVNECLQSEDREKKQDSEISIQ